MSEQSSYELSYETLMRLIGDVEAARKPERYALFHTPSVWKHELSSHPERFRMENGELLWWGCRVVVISSIASEREEKKFWHMVNQFVSNGIIS